MFVGGTFLHGLKPCMLENRGNLSWAVLCGPEGRQGCRLRFVPHRKHLAGLRTSSLRRSHPALAILQPVLACPPRYCLMVVVVQCGNRCAKRSGCIGEQALVLVAQHTK